MKQALSLSALLVAGFALPALAEDTSAPTASEPAEQAQSAPALTDTDATQTQVPFKMVRTLGGRSCTRTMGGRRIIWKGPPPPQAH